ncbi:YgjV family protein [Oricola sp.]|uniref:YgjV family protein n=1 Tax=Oricola sp. TaxID=1979950 RepID=UPI0025CCB07A|nr:YgjV family protein [Oricola sp.]MCI5075889.1 YgjV family protein [Oricola sp.]
MNGINQLLQDAPLAAVFGAAGLMCQLAWPLFRSRRKILAVQLGIGSSYAASYALLDAWSGVGVCSVGATQTLIALIAGDRPWLRRMGFVFIPVVGAISFATWSGIASFFAMTACCLIMIGRMQRDTLAMRCFLVAASPFGIGYDLTVGAAPALAGAIISAGLGFAALIRELNARHERDDLPHRVASAHAVLLRAASLMTAREERRFAS